MQKLIDTAAEIYQEKREIKATALELDLPLGKVKKLLITGNVLSYPETKQIQDLMQQGKTMAEIQRIMGLSYSALYTYLPGNLSSQVQQQIGKDFRGGVPVEAFARTMIQLFCKLGQSLCRKRNLIGVFGNVLPQQAVDLLV